VPPGPSGGLRRPGAPDSRLVLRRAGLTHVCLHVQHLRPPTRLRSRRVAAPPCQPRHRRRGFLPVGRRQAGAHGRLLRALARLWPQTVEASTARLLESIKGTRPLMMDQGSVASEQKSAERKEPAGTRAVAVSKPSDAQAVSVSKETARDMGTIDRAPTSPAAP